MVISHFHPNTSRDIVKAEAAVMRDMTLQTTGYDGVNLYLAKIAVMEIRIPFAS